jgi:hypothetical protein
MSGVVSSLEALLVQRAQISVDRSCRDASQAPPSIQMPVEQSREADAPALSLSDQNHGMAQVQTCCERGRQDSGAAVDERCS